MKLHGRIGEKGRYEIVKVIHGGMGIVYIVFDHELRIVWALKTLRDELMLNEKTRKNFYREALIWKKMEKHSNIVYVNHIEEIYYRLFIVMEYVSGDEHGRNTLQHYINPWHPLSMRKTLDWGIQFCFGMEHAVSKGVAPHRDIKPQNIMIANDGLLKITDFGLASIIYPFDTESDHKHTGGRIKHGSGFYETLEGRIVGTFTHMAPEQFDGKTNIQSDIYSFGIVLYQMVSGKLPFETTANTTDEYIKKFEVMHKKGKVDELDSPIWPIIKRCLSINPEKRFNDFNSIRNRFEELFRRHFGNDIPKVPGIDEMNARELCNRGLDFITLGFIDEAIKSLKEAAKINPKLPGVHGNLGIAYGRKYGTGCDEQIKEYEEFIRLNPNDYKVHYNLGIAYGLKYGEGSRQQISEFEKAIKIDPNDADVHINLGIAYGHKYGNGCDKQINEYEKAVSIDPNYAKAHFNLGSAYGDRYGYGFDKQIEQYEMAIEIDSNFSDAYIALGSAYCERGDARMCVYYLKQFLKLFPGDHRRKNIEIALREIVG